MRDEILCKDMSEIHWDLSPKAETRPKRCPKTVRKMLACRIVIHVGGDMPAVLNFESYTKAVRVPNSCKSRAVKSKNIPSRVRENTHTIWKGMSTYGTKTLAMNTKNATTTLNKCEHVMGNTLKHAKTH